MIKWQCKLYLQCNELLHIISNIFLTRRHILITYKVHYVLKAQIITFFGPDYLGKRFLNLTFRFLFFHITL